MKDSLRADLTDRLTQSQITNLRQQLVSMIAATLVVDDPVLAKQYEAKKSQTDTAVHGKKETLDAIKSDERRAAERRAGDGGHAGGTTAAGDQARRGMRRA